MQVTAGVQPDGVLLTVENTGETLAPEPVSRLVEPFLRGTERTRADHGGVGLGLAIVKSITQAHDGTLTLASRAGGGLRVTVRLPAAPRSTQPATASPCRAAGHQRRATRPLLFGTSIWPPEDLQPAPEGAWILVICQRPRAAHNSNQTARIDGRRVHLAGLACQRGDHGR